MAIERTYYCDGPDCGDGQPCHSTTATPPPHLPSGFLEVREVCDQPVEPLHFCGWDCLMKYAAAQPVPEIIEFDPQPPGDPA